ncbi:MAG TPA: homoserine O-acetyltransferase [Candidatus Kapabacteria bacterium]|nr:homoserine O-acetyltransferase [Candidatus Kapabacteria bacterium]
MSDPLQRTVGALRLTQSDEPFVLESGATLAPLVAAYETYGRLNAARSNAIVVCHALTGSAHAAGHDKQGRAGWWNGLIGPGCAIDTERWFVICPNVIGSCYGSTGPASISAATGSAYGAAFPVITVRDIVRAQRLLIGRLGVQQIHAVIGGSMGGMQTIEWALLYPGLVGRIVPIAASAAHSPWCIGFNAIAREALALGAAAGDAEAGLRLARKVAMMSYRSDVEFAARFGRDRQHRPLHGDGGFAVEGYLEHHGRSLAARFSAESLAVLTRAMDLHDVARGRGERDDVLASIRQQALVIGITSDVLYPEHEQRALARAIPNAGYEAIDSPYGHDAFLIEIPRLAALVRPFIEEGCAAVNQENAPASAQSFVHHHEEVETV